MKNVLWLVTLVLSAGPSLTYFKYQRPVQITGAGQHYLVIDKSIWKRARADLGDLRLYAGETETPYALVVERGGRERQRTDVPVLQQSTIAGKTQFLIDMSQLAEYDHVDLKLATKNFVAHARVEGQDDPHRRHWASMGDSILYDLSKENLGANHALRLPRATYKVRGGQKIDSEDADVDFYGNGQVSGLKIIMVVIHNGDDQPLKLTGATLQQLERRLYFDAPTGGQLTLYYGDEKLEQPVYDYAKLFQQAKAAAPAQLGPEASNAAYTGRPDDRPWSERHPALLWAAIIAAVTVLGGVALRSIRTATA